MKKLCLLLAALLLLGACESTGDPKQGGIFWSESKAQHRQAERKSRLGALKQEQQAEESRSGELSATASSKRNKRDAMRKKVKSMDADCAQLKQQLDDYKAVNDAQAGALADLKARQANLRQRARDLMDDGDTAAQEAEAERLQKEVDQLTNDFNALSQL